MSKLIAKPWNDPWNRAAMKQRGYRAYTYQHRDAARLSWRRLKKMAGKVERGAPVHGRVERRIARAYAAL